MLDNPDDKTIIVDEDDQLKKIIETLGPLSDEESSFLDSKRKREYLSLI